MGKRQNAATGLYICCPGCGKQLFRSFQTDSTIICPTCHKHIYAYNSGDLLIQTSASRVEDKLFLERMRSFVFEFSGIHGQQHMDH